MVPKLAADAQAFVEPATRLKSSLPMIDEADKSKEEPKPSILPLRYLLAKLNTRVVVVTFSRSDEVDVIRFALADNALPNVAVCVRACSVVWLACPLLATRLDSWRDPCCI